MSLPSIVGTLFLLLAAVSAAAQTTIRVPAHKPTIQSAIDFAAHGDTVLVSPGTYYENINFNGKSIILTSTDGAETTIIDGGALKHVVRIEDVPGTSAVLNGFTIRNGRVTNLIPYDGVGIRVSNASPTISNNVVSGNNGCGVPGIFLQFSPSPIIKNNRISGNRQIGCSGGGGGGGLVVFGGGAQITGNTIVANTYSNGGGVWIGGATGMTFQNNVISQNTATSDGGGLLITGGIYSSVFSQNLITRNTAGRFGGGVYFEATTSSQDSFLFMNNTIAENVANGPNNSSGFSASAIHIERAASGIGIYNNAISTKNSLMAVVCDFGIFPITLPTFRNNVIYAGGFTPYSTDCGTIGGVTTNPLFVAPALGDYHLGGLSPAIDAGDAALGPLPATDFAGSPRITDGNGDAIAQVDAGAYEHSPTSLAASVNSLSFGPQAVGSSSPPQTVTFTNTGTGPLHIGATAALAEFPQTNDCAPREILPGETCQFSFTFKPSTRGGRSATAVFIANTAAGGFTLSLTGSGIGPELQVSPASLAFSAQAFGTQSAVQAITITNIGELPATMTSITSSSADFPLVHDCGASLASLVTCSASVTFSPTQRGARTGSATIGGTTPGGPKTIALSGAGLAPIATFSPNQLSFSALAYGMTSPAKSVTLTNTGDIPLAISGVTLTADFSQTNNCPATLAVAAQCSLAVSFSPVAAGWRYGSLSLQANAPSSSVTLNGFGQAPSLQLSYTSVSFGEQLFGVASASRIVTLQNVGDSPLTFGTVTTLGDFEKTSDCPATLSVNASCSLSIVFTPTQLGARVGSISIPYNGPSGSASIALSGLGVQLQFEPTLLILDATSVGKSSPAKTARFVNYTNGPVSLSAVSVSGDFQQTNNCPGTLPAGTECTFSLVFAPTALGNRSGSLSLTDGAGTVRQLALSGMGVTGQISFYPYPTFSPRVVGTTATATLVVTNVGTGPLTITAVTLPQYFSQTNDCPPGLVVGGSCTLTIQFAPGAAGQFNGPVQIFSDSLSSPHSITIGAVGYATYPVPYIYLLSPAALPVGSGSTLVTVTGSYYFPSSVIRWNGEARPTTYLDGEHLQFTASEADLANMEPVSISVFNPAPAGGIDSSPLILYQSVPIMATSLAYDPYARRIMAPVSSPYAVAYANSVITLNPWNSTVEATVPVGTDPNDLIISDNGKTGYVTIDSGRTIRKLSLPARTADSQFSLGSEPFGGTYYVEKMLFLPGSDTSIVVSRMHPGQSPRHEGVVVYDQAVKRPDEVSPHTALANTIAFGSDGSKLYGYNNETSSFEFTRMSIDASGIHFVDKTSSLIAGGYGVTLASDGSLIYATSGSIVNPIVPHVAGGYSLTYNYFYSYNTTSVLPAPTVGKTFFLGYAVGYQHPLIMNIFSQAPQYHQYIVPFDIIAATDDLIRWGTDGIAFRTSVGWTNQIILFRTSLLHPTANTNVPVTLSPVSPQTITTGTSNTVLTLTGSGFVNGMRVLWGGEERTTIFVNASTLQANIPAADLAQAANNTLTVVPFDSNTPLATTTVAVEGPNVGTSIPAGGDIFSGPLPVGRRTALSQQFIENTTAVPLPVGDVSISSDGDFTMMGSNCPTVLGAGEMCDLTISFAPRAPGPRRAELSVTLGKQTTLLPMMAIGFDLKLSLDRAKRPARSPEPTAATMETFASVQVVGIPQSQVRLGCVGAPTGTSCDATYVNDDTALRGEGLSAGNVRITLRRSGRLITTGIHTVNLTATVGDYTETLPIQFNVPAAVSAPRKPQRLSRK